VSTSRFGRYGRISRRHPEAYGICDRGGEARKLHELLPEMEWRGGQLVPNGWRVCRHHMDLPNPQLGGEQVIRPDPVPVHDPRPDPDPPIIYLTVLTDPHGSGSPMLDRNGGYLLSPSPIGPT
jgi:hypothetical protein